MSTIAYVTAVNDSAFANCVDVIYREIHDDRGNPSNPIFTSNGIKKILTTYNNTHPIGTRIYHFTDITMSDPILPNSYTPVVAEVKINYDQESVLSRTIEASEANPVLIKLACFITGVFDGDTNDFEIDFVGEDESVEVVIEAGTFDGETEGLQAERSIRITQNGKLSLQYSKTGEPAEGQLTVVAEIVTLQ